jgi:short-subunit dehydrogenase
MAKRVLITGCSSGIGRALAGVLTERGYEVIATARNLDSLAEVPAAQKLALDVTSDASVAAAVAAAGPVDVLVNNAGVGLWGPSEAVTMADAVRLFETNLFGVMRMHKAVLPQMRARKSGMIVQVSSVAGRGSGPLLGHYSASKQALNAISAALRIELAMFGIKVTVIDLQAVDSDFGRNRTMVSDPAYQKLVDHFTAKIGSHRKSAQSSEETARGIADVIDAGAPDLNAQIDDVARQMVAARLAQSPEEWERNSLAGLIEPGHGTAA